MKYVSIDIETTDLDPSCGQILEFAAVFDDTSLSRPLGEFTTRIMPHQPLSGGLVALCMNANLLDEIRTQGGIKISELADKFREQLAIHGFDEPFTVAGKNFASFDGPWLSYHCGERTFPKWRHRVLDVGSMYARSNDEMVPSLDDCLVRLYGEPQIKVKHRALQDARDICALVRGGLRS